MCSRWIKENVPDWQQTVVCSPDEGGTRRAGILAEKLHLPMALIHKESFNEEHIISGNVHDKKVTIITMEYRTTQLKWGDTVYKF